MRYHAESRDPPSPWDTKQGSDNAPSVPGLARFRPVSFDPKQPLGRQAASLSAMTALSSAMLPLGALERATFSRERVRVS